MTEFLHNPTCAMLKIREETTPLEWHANRNTICNSRGALNTRSRVAQMNQSADPVANETDPSYVKAGASFEYVGEVDRAK
ncbi:hypothetical protein FRC09_003524 [Ceratobasidium sp. 395]|nr:hypothetical protein FRC09_003524 [Ceratobasidium sp. 395]